MRTLLTGGTGYLGSLLAKRLTAGGHELGCVVRDPERLGRLEPLRDRVVLIPVREMGPAISRFAPDVAIHTAGSYARGSNTEEDVFQGNLDFPFHVMQAAREAGVRQWINTSTFLPPMLNSYALSKRQLSQWGRHYAGKGEFQFVDLVLEQFYGLDAPAGHFLTWVVRKLKAGEPLDLTAGTQRRDFIYVEDVLNVYEAVLRTPLDGQVLEIPVGTGETPAIREVVEYLKLLTRSESELRFGAIPMRAGEPDSSCDTRMMRSLGVDRPLHWKDGMRCLLEADTHTGGPING